MQKDEQNYTRPSDEELAEAICDAYSAFVGGGEKKKSVKDFAQEMGCSPSAVYQLKSGELKPGSILLLQSAAILGPGFLNKITSRIGMGGLYSIQGDNIAVLDLAAQLNDTSSETLRASADGIVDHREAAALVTKYRANATKQNELADQLEQVALSGGSVPVIPGKR